MEELSEFSEFSELTEWFSEWLGEWFPEWTAEWVLEWFLEWSPHWWLPEWSSTLTTCLSPELARGLTSEPNSETQLGLFVNFEPSPILWTFASFFKAFSIWDTLMESGFPKSLPLYMGERGSSLIKIRGKSIGSKIDGHNWGPNFDSSLWGSYRESSGCFYSRVRICRCREQRIANF